MSENKKFESAVEFAHQLAIAISEFSAFVRYAKLHTSKSAKELKKLTTFETQSGMRVPSLYFLMNETHVKVEDIAHSLSHVCRYNGHIGKFYSVAQHSIIMSRLVDPEYALEALLHDATEAYFADIALPIKKFFPLYYRIEEHIWKKAIVPAFRGFLPEKISSHVKFFDWVMLAVEKRDLIDPYRKKSGVPWDLPDYDISKIDKIVPMSPEEAKRAFISRYTEIVMGMIEKEKQAHSLLTGDGYYA